MKEVEYRVEWTAPPRLGEAAGRALARAVVAGMERKKASNTRGTDDGKATHKRTGAGALAPAG